MSGVSVNPWSPFSLCNQTTGRGRTGGVGGGLCLERHAVQKQSPPKNRLWEWSKSSNSCTLKKRKKTLYTPDTVWNISKPYHCLYLVHDRSLNRNAHWQKPEARRLPHFFFFINCTLLSRFTANFCQLQCSLSAKMWVWSFVLRGMMQPRCNTKQIMLLATEVFLVPFFKRISFYIVKFHFFNSMHPRSVFFSSSPLSFFFLLLSTTKVALCQTPSPLQVWIVAAMCQ